jgi:hypothetical protein
LVILRKGAFIDVEALRAGVSDHHAWNVCTSVIDGQSSGCSL